MTLLQRLITTVLTYLNASGFYKDAGEIKNAVNVTQIDLYKRLRGNMAQYGPGRPSSAVYPEITSTATDAIAELYTTILLQPDPSSNIVTIDPIGINRTIDIVMSLEVSYNDSPNVYYPVNIVPDNQFLMLANNPVVPPVTSRPLGRMFDLYNYNVVPSATLNSCRAKVLFVPNPVDFYFQDNGTAIPDIIPVAGGEMDWTEEKLDNLVYGTIAALGFNLSNGVLVQSGNAMNEKIL